MAETTQAVTPEATPVVKPNPYFERMLRIKSESLLSPEKIIQVATVYLTWGKITEAQYDEIVG